METLTSKEYAKVISETSEEKENREAYEANLIAMGKDSANQIQDAFIQGKLLVLKYIMERYKEVKDYFNEKQSGLSWEVLDEFMVSCADYITEEME